MAASVVVSNQLTVSSNGPNSWTSTGTQLIQIAVTVPASTTNQEYDIAFATALINEVFLISTQNLTLLTNSTGSPSQTLTFTANVPLLWSSQMPNGVPITADNTKFYLTNATATDAILSGYVLHTPA